MELRTLEYFLTVAREQNITHAAEKLNIAQPPLSRQLRQLEEEVGGLLFTRGKKGIQLTAEGKYLAQQAEAILDMASLTRQHLLTMHEESVKGTLSLCATETCSSSIFPEIIPAFQAQYPLINYNIWCGNSNDVCQRVEQGINDIGFLRNPFHSQNLESFSLKKEPWIAVVSQKNPLSTQTHISLRELCCYPLIIPSRHPLQDDILHWLSVHTTAAQIICLYNQAFSILPLVSENLGIAVCPNSIKSYSNSRQLAYLDIIPSSYISDLVMVRKRNQILPLNSSTFWDFICEYYA